MAVQFDSSKCEGTVVKLTLDDEVRLYRCDDPIELGTQIPHDDYKIINISENPFYLEPGQSALIQSVEVILVPKNMKAQIFGRTNVKIPGLMVNPVYYNSGYRGKVGVLVVNNGSVPVRFVAGVEIYELSLRILSKHKMNRRKRK